MTRLTIAAVLGALALGSAVGLMATSGYLISRAAQQPPVLTLMVAIVAVRAFGIGRGVFRYGERLLGHDAAFRLLERLRVRVYERLADGVALPLRAGELLARFVADVDQIQDRYLRGWLPSVGAVLVSAAAVTVQTAILPAAGVTLLSCLLIAGVGAPWLSLLLARRAEAATVDDRSDLTAATVSVLRGMPELIAYGTADRALSGVAVTGRRLTRSGARSAWTSGLGSFVTGASLAAAVLGALVTGIPAVRAGALDGVLLAVIVLTPLAAFEAVNGLPQAAQELVRARRSAARVRSMVATPAAVTSPVTPAGLPAPPYTISIRDLRARWPGSEAWVLDGFSLEVRPGERIALIGPSGAGKSTLAAVLLRFLDYSGAVSLNGVPLASLDGDDVRRVIGLCAQDAHVFDTTVAENVRLARPDATDPELAEALARAGLANWPAGLADGLSTRLGEHGVAVSGGERQRIALARALLADFPILILDEPDAHLDAATAAAVLEDAMRAAGDRSVILITHRPIPSGLVDRVVTLSHARPPVLASPR